MVGGRSGCAACCWVRFAAPLTRILGSFVQKSGRWSVTGSGVLGKAPATVCGGPCVRPPLRSGLRPAGPFVFPPVVFFLYEAVKVQANQQTVAYYKNTRPCRRFRDAKLREVDAEAPELDPVPP